jgi:hypothetical protein
VDLKYVFDIIETAPDNRRMKSPGERSRSARYSSRSRASGAGRNAAAAEINKPAPRPYAAVRKIATINLGTGSTLTTRVDRGLMQVTTRGADRYTHLGMTSAGRKLVRSCRLRHCSGRCAC